MTDLPLPSFCDTLPAHQRRALLNNREAYAAFHTAAKAAELQAECARLREALAISRAQFSDLQTLIKISADTDAALRGKGTP